MFQVSPRMERVGGPVMTSVDRLAQGYQPDFDIDLDDMGSE